MITNIITTYRNNIRCTCHIADRTIACPINKSRLLITIEINIACITIDFYILTILFTFNFQGQLIVSILVCSWIITGHYLSHSIITSCFWINSRSSSNITIESLSKVWPNNGTRYCVIISSRSISYCFPIAIVSDRDTYCNTIFTLSIGHNNLKIKSSRIITIRSYLTVPKVNVRLLPHFQCIRNHWGNECLNHFIRMFKVLFKGNSLISFITCSNTNDSMFSFFCKELVHHTCRIMYSNVTS